MKRREILKTGALTTAAGLLGCARSVSSPLGGVAPRSTLPRLRRVRNQGAPAPSLAAMTRKALDVMSGPETGS